MEDQQARIFRIVQGGCEAANDGVERSLFERAVGYTHESVKIFMPAGADKPVYPPYKQRACAAEILAEQISGNAIRPLLPEPTIIEHASIESSAIRPQQPAAPAPGVTTAGELRIHPPQAYDGADDERLARRRDASSQQPSNMQPMPGGAMPYLPCPGQLSARTHPAAADDERIAGDCPCGNPVRDHRHAEPAAKRMPCHNCVVMT